MDENPNPESSPANPFLAEILAKPDADGPRLVYADWLIEQGDPRGPFIVDQCRLAAMDESDPEWCVLHARTERLRARHQSEWARPISRILGLSEDEEEDEVWLPDDQQRFEFRRGFVEVVNVPVQKTAILEALVRVTPLRGVSASPSHEAGELGALVASLGLRELEVNLDWWGDDYDLDYGDDEPADEDAYELYPQDEEDVPPAGLEFLSALDLSRVETLAVRGYLPQIEDIRRLAQQIASAPLRSLTLAGMNITSKGAVALAGTLPLDKLDELDLSDNNIGVQGLRKVLSSMKSAGLALSVSGNYKLRDHVQLIVGHGLRAIDAQGLVTDALIEGLAADEGTARLRHLCLGGLQEPQLLRLAQSPFEALTRLDLGGYEEHRTSADAIRALLGTPKAERLVELNLSGLGIGDDGAEVLIASPHLARLTSLDLSMCRLTERSAAALAAWPGLANVVRLRLGGNRFGTAGMTALIGSPHLQPVELSLDTPRNRRMQVALYERFGEAVQLW